MLPKTELHSALRILDEVTLEQVLVTSKDIKTSTYVYEEKKIKKLLDSITFATCQDMEVF